MTTAAGLSIYGEDYLAKYTSAFAPQAASAEAAPPQPFVSQQQQQQLLRTQPLHPGQQAAQKAATNSSAASHSGSSAFLQQQGRAALVTGSGPMALYQTGRESGHFRSDPRQRLTVTMLQVRVCVSRVTVVCFVLCRAGHIPHSQALSSCHGVGNHSNLIESSGFDSKECGSKAARHTCPHEIGHAWYVCTLLQ